jgi:hypothetical protein
VGTKQDFLNDEPIQALKPTRAAHVGFSYCKVTEGGSTLIVRAANSNNCKTRRLAMKVRHATLLNVFGRPAQFAGFTIIPAEVHMEGRSFSPSFPLADLPALHIPPIFRLPIKEHCDVACVFNDILSSSGPRRLKPSVRGRGSRPLLPLPV